MDIEANRVLLLICAAAIFGMLISGYILSTYIVDDIVYQIVIVVLVCIIIGLMHEPISFVRTVVEID